MPRHDRSTGVHEPPPLAVEIRYAARLRRQRLTLAPRIHHVYNRFHLCYPKLDLLVAQLRVICWLLV